MGASEQVYGVSDFQASPGSRHHLEDMLIARQQMITQGLGSPESPKGRGLKRASDAPPEGAYSCTLQVTQRCHILIQRLPWYNPPHMR
jgi:hypothetical protein